MLQVVALGLEGSAALAAAVRSLIGMSALVFVEHRWLGAAHATILTLVLAAPAIFSSCLLPLKGCWAVGRCRGGGWRGSQQAIGGGEGRLYTW